MEINLTLDPDFERCLDRLVTNYGTDFLKLEGIDPAHLDNSAFMDKFAQTDTVADATIDPNANANFKDLKSYLTEKEKSVNKLFGLSKIFRTIKKQWGLKTAQEWFEQQFTKGFYLNDSATASFFPYCWANSLEKLAKEGLFFLPSYNNEPPKHLTTFLDDVIEFVSFLSNRQSGAVGIPDVVIWIYYFWKKDVEEGYYLKDPDYYLRQNIQKLIYRLNQPFIRVDQSAFTNVSIFDRCYLEEMFGGLEFPDGSFAIDSIEEMIECEKVFMEVASDIRSTNMFTFPVFTYSLYYKDDEFKDEEFARWCSKHNCKWFDSNFFVCDKIGVLSSCCRLLNDTTKLDTFVNSIGGSGLSVGSCRVSTINLARIAFESNCSLSLFLAILRYKTKLNCKALSSMRHILKRNIEKGLMPNYCEGGLDLSKQFCTIGLNGFFEAIELLGGIEEDEMGYIYYSDEGLEIAEQIFNTITEVKDDFECDFTFNIEQVPAENSAGVLAKADSLLYPNEATYNIYSNQWIPLTEKCSIKEKCRLSSMLDAKCGGGAIAHINIEGRFPNEEEAWKLLNYVASTGTMYFAFNALIGTCEDHHAFIGSEVCPVCGKPVKDKWTRVVGFYRPIADWQEVRRKEGNRRRWYRIGGENEQRN